jgi:hypothetical protein
LSILQSSATFRACIREITATLNNVPLDFYGKIATANGLKMILRDVNFASSERDPSGVSKATIALTKTKLYAPNGQAAPSTPIAEEGQIIDTFRSTGLLNPKAC